MSVNYVFIDCGKSKAPMVLNFAQQFGCVLNLFHIDFQLIPIIKRQKNTFFSLCDGPSHCHCDCEHLAPPTFTCVKEWEKTMALIRFNFGQQVVYVLKMNISLHDVCLSIESLRKNHFHFV